jgi:hypothetical protein
VSDSELGTVVTKLYEGPINLIIKSKNPSFKSCKPRIRDSITADAATVVYCFAGIPGVFPKKSLNSRFEVLRI